MPPRMDAGYLRRPSAGRMSRSIRAGQRPGLQKTTRIIASFCRSRPAAKSGRCWHLGWRRGYCARGQTYTLDNGRADRLLAVETPFHVEICRVGTVYVFQNGLACPMNPVFAVYYRLKLLWIDDKSLFGRRGLQTAVKAKDRQSFRIFPGTHQGSPQLTRVGSPQGMNLQKP